MSHYPAPKTGWLAYYAELVGSWAKRHAQSHEAEDAVQNSAVHFLSKDAAAVLNHKAYLHRASQNHLLNEYRRQSRYDAISLEDLSENEHPVFNSPDANLSASQLAQALEHALALLPLKKRQVFIYHRLEGYTHHEIAQRMGLALNTVERYVMDATRHVRSHLQEFCGS